MFIAASPLLMKTVLCFVIPSLLEGVSLLSRQQVAIKQREVMWRVTDFSDGRWFVMFHPFYRSDQPKTVHATIKCFVGIISSAGRFPGVWLWAHNVWKVVERTLLNLGQFNVFMGGLLLALKPFYNPALKTGLPVQSTSQQNSQQQLDWQVSQMHARIHFLLPQNFTNIPEENCFSYFF